MKYLVDTDWVIDYLKGSEPARTVLPTLLSDGLGISIITFSEVYEGVYHSRDPKSAEAAFLAFLKGVQVVAVNRAVAKKNAQIRGDLRKAGKAIDHRALDLLIAATAITHHSTLLTNNRRHYSDVPGLILYR